MPRLNRNAVLRQARARANLDTGTYHAAGDVLSYLYYDTERIVTASVATLRFFLNGVTSPFQLVPAVVKTGGDTNMLSSGIPSNQKWLVSSINVIYVAKAAFSEATALTFMNYLNNTVLTVRIDGKDKVYERKLSGMLGLRTNFVVTPAVAGDNSHVPVTNISSYVSLGKQIELSANTTWSIELVQHVAVPAAQNNDDISIELPVTLGRLS